MARVVLAVAVVATAVVMAMAAPTPVPPVQRMLELARERKRQHVDAHASAHAYHAPEPAIPATVFLTNGEYAIKTGVIDRVNGVAYGSYAPRLNSTGWGVLDIVTNSAFTDAEQMYGAGYLEGALTYQQIYEMYRNMQFTFFNGGDAPAALLSWFDDNNAYVSSMVASNPDDPFWVHIGLVVQQFNGEVAGYASAAAAADSGVPALNAYAFSILNGVGDLLDLMNVVEPSRRLPEGWEDAPANGRVKPSPEVFSKFALSHSLCSALIKITPDFSEIFAGHSSWFTYSAMNRIFKSYTFHVSTSPATTTMMFSSYPGFLESLDDFYIMDSGLTMIQTSLSIFNMSLYDSVVPQSLLAWHRVRTANWLAKDGPEWASILARENSGTYNNEYMVLNYNLFTAGEPLPNNALWVVEQIPTLVQSADVTNVLAAGYWPSYNVPYFENVFNLSGFAAAVQQYGTDYSYELAPRAQIFRRDQSTVKDMPSFEDMLRYNDYTKDPISKGDPMKAICSRGDLSATPNMGGCYDTKVTNSVLAKQLKAYALNGPTTSHNLPVFSWATGNNNAAASHFGEPTVYNFPFVVVQPASFVGTEVDGDD